MKRNLTINGYKWFAFDNDYHHFQKNVNGTQWLEIRCTEAQLSNGDVEYMTANNLTQAH